MMLPMLARMAVTTLAMLCAVSDGRAKAQARPAANSVRDVAKAESSIVAAPILRDISMLASDGFAGRAPGTRGEDSSVAFLQREFRRIGLAPGNPNGTYIQQVPLVGTTSTVEAQVTVNGRSGAFRQLDDVVLWSLHPNAVVNVASAEMVFVGYGVVAPEYRWDDFKGVDVRARFRVPGTTRAIAPRAQRRVPAAGATLHLIEPLGAPFLFFTKASVTLWDAPLAASDGVVLTFGGVVAGQSRPFIPGRFSASLRRSVVASPRPATDRASPAIPRSRRRHAPA